MADSSSSTCSRACCVHSGPHLCCVSCPSTSTCPCCAAHGGNRATVPQYPPVACEQPPDATTTPRCAAGVPVYLAGLADLDAAPLLGHRLGAPVEHKGQGLDVQPLVQLLAVLVPQLGKKHLVRIRPLPEGLYSSRTQTRSGALLPARVRITGWHQAAQRTALDGAGVAGGEPNTQLELLGCVLRTDHKLLTRPGGCLRALCSTPTLAMSANCVRRAGRFICELLCR